MDAEAEPTSPRHFRGLLAVIGAGLFVTGFGWPGTIGELPFNGLLKDHLALGPRQVTLFWATATLAWYCKPLVGLVTDSYPLGGTRHRGYLLWGSIAAGLAWMAFAAVPRRYLPLLAVMTALNFAMVFVSVVVSGALVQVGQRHAATGRTSSLFSAVDGAVALAAGPVSGWLATRAFGWTAFTGAAILFAYVPIVALAFREPPAPRPGPAVWTTAKRQLGTIATSWPTWAATILLFLSNAAPGLQTPLYFYQRDVLGFSPGFIGTLRLLGGAGVLVGSAAYGAICRRVSLRISLPAGITLNAAAALLYLLYASPTAATLIDSTVAVVGTMAMVPVYDVATRATPAESESFAFGLMLSLRNLAIFVVSSYAGAVLYERYGFRALVWINAGCTLAVLAFLPLLPRALLAGREQSLVANE